MDQALGLSWQERFSLAIEKFWRAHIVDDDPYDALENERFEAMIRAMEAAEDDSSAVVELRRAA